MIQLAHKDLQHLLEYIRELYTFRAKEDFTDHVVESISTLVEIDVAAYNEINQVQGGAIFKMAPLSFPALPNTQEILSYYSNNGNEVFDAYVQHLSNFHVCKYTDLFSFATLRNSGPFVDFYIPNKTRFTLATNLRKHSDLIFPLSLHRNHKDFSARDTQILTLASFHLEQAYTNSLQVTRLQEELTGYEDGFDALTQSIVEINAKGQVVWATKAAWECLGRYGHFSRHAKDSLPSPFLEWVRLQDALLDDPDTAPLAYQPEMITLRGHRVMARLVRKNQNHLLFFEEESSPPPVVELRHHGLTTREQEVAGWVVRGKTNDEIGQILEISHETVHRHLSSIYRKLEVENRTSLVNTLKKF
jgi:DNA-binding CsgD family transcriptional regulator